MVRLVTSGDAVRWTVAAFLAVTIASCLCFAGSYPPRTFTVPDDILTGGEHAVVAIPVPECEDIEVSFQSMGRRLEANLVQTAYIRGQRIALFELHRTSDLSDEISIRLSFVEATGEAFVDAGPLTGVCGRALVGYGIPPSVAPTLGFGTISRCQNLLECRNAGADILLVTGNAVYGSSYVDSLAGLWADRMGLNVAIINVVNISPYSPVEIRDFIRDLYNSGTAEHFGDGRLGFVVLLGDAYEDDNLTQMIPEYDGYGGNANASDHFYACVSGTDDFEDLMIGRIPVGTVQELIDYYEKLASYSPLPQEEWTKSILFAGGCYFADPNDYVTHFDSLEAYIGGGFSVSRFYRYDFPATSLGDAQACQALIDSLDAGKLFLMYSGDGDKWDWGARFERVFRSDLIDNLDNSGRLPIVLSISCSNGWFDNIIDTYTDGGVDCFAERLLTQPEGGAIACLASSREAGGNASVVFAPEIIKSAFVNGSSFLGELILEAKTQHLLKLGQVVLVRQFNLFGDPCLNYILNDFPVAAPDLVIRPYSVNLEPEFPVPGKPIEFSAEVWNASGVPTGACEVTLYSDHPDSGGTPLATQVVGSLSGWERTAVSFTLNDVSAGDLNAFLFADASDAIQESDEANNMVQRAAYVYPCEWGYPIKLSDDVEGHVVADLNCDGKADILITSGGTQAMAIDLEGNTLWLKDDLGLPQWFAGIQPSAFDLNGDGTTEAVLTTRSAVQVVEGATGSTIWKRYTEYPVVSPIVTDISGNGHFDIIAGTYTSPFSRIYAFDASGSYIWIYDVPGFGEKLTGLVVCDVDLDGMKEVIYSSDEGNLKCLSCSSNPPATVWERPLTSGEITCIVGGDIDRNGTIEIIASCDSTVYVVDAGDGDVKSTIPSPVCISRMSLGNLDDDLSLEIVCVSDCGRILEIDNGSVVLNIQAGGIPAGAPVLGDFNQDGSTDIIVATQEGIVRILEASGSNLLPPMPMRGSCLSGPAAQDIDEDGNIEILAGSSDSLLFVLDLGVEGGRLEWLCEGCTGTRTGLYAQPLYGHISEDVGFTDRVDVVGDIVIDSTGCLTLERGTDVRFVHDLVSPVGSSPGLCELDVSGQLISVGSATALVTLRPISFPSSKDEWVGILLNEYASASLTRTYICGAVTAIECNASDVYISECVIMGSSLGIKITGAAPLIDSNLITGNTWGINSNNSSPIIVGNQVIENLYSGVVLSSSSLAVLDNNTIEKTLQGHGLACYSSSPNILGGNTIRSNSQSGIYLSNSSPLIDSCWIGWNGDCGIKAAYYSDPEVKKTSVVANRIGIGVYVYANPVLGDTIAGIGGDNDIRQNDLYALYNTTSNAIKAHRTWWGADPPDPADFMGSVDYSGWLSLPPAGIEDGNTVSTLVRAPYPNPFSSVIRLSLDVTESHLPVDVSIYDIRGSRLRRIALVEVPGEIRAEWDGRDARGDPVASGAYFLSVASKTGVHTRKIILLR